MRISYLDISFSGQAIIDYKISYLFCLIRLAVARMRLQIEDFRDSIAPKNVTASLKLFPNAKRLKSCTLPENLTFVSASLLRVCSGSLCVRAIILSESIVDNTGKQLVLKGN